MGEDHHTDKPAHQEAAQHHTADSAPHDDHAVLPPIGQLKAEKIHLQLYENLKPILPGHHHHHHHHSTVKYKAPEKLTESLALYAIKKLSILDHLPQYDLRVINPVPPGLLSWAVAFGSYSATGLWGVYVWKNLGFKGFAGKGGLIFGGLFIGSNIAIRATDELRELTGIWRRKKLAQEYRTRLGDAYLLKVLDPAFRVAHNTH